MWSSIRNHFVLLVEDQDTRLLLDHLYQEKVFTDEDCSRVRGVFVKQEKNRLFFEILKKKSEESLHKYVTALKNSNQEVLANLIWGEHLGAYNTDDRNDDEKKVESRKDKLKRPRQKNTDQMSDKLQNLFCLGGCGLETDLYPYLVCNGLTESSAFYNDNFKFLSVVPWKVIFEFQEVATASGRSLYTYFENNLQSSMNVRFVDEFDTSKKGEENLEETIRNSAMPMWLFANGHANLDKPILSAKEWRRQYSEGFKEALRMLCCQTPKDRVIVVYLLLSENYNVMLSNVDDFFSKFLDNWLLIAESDELCSKWKEELIRRELTDEQTFKDHSVIGMSWSHINYTFKNLFNKTTSKMKDVPSSSDTNIPLSLKIESNLTDLEVIGSTDITNVPGFHSKLGDDTATEYLSEESKDAEEKFYRGEQVSWANFYFKSHVMRRDKFGKLNDRVRKLLVGNDIDEDQRVGQVNLYHQPAAGGTTLAREILWEHKSYYRCVVVKNLSDKTVEQIFRVRSFEDSDPRPMLLLLDNFDSDQIALFIEELVREAKKPYHEGYDQVLFVLLICFRKTSLQFDANKNTFKLFSQLSDRELAWMHRKYEELDQDYQIIKKRNPKNFISFNTLKENFSPEYIKRTVQELVSNIDNPQEKLLLKYISIINTFDLLVRPLPIASFDGIMPEKHWERYTSEPLRMLLNEVSSRGFNENRSVRIINSLLARYVFEVLCCSAGDSDKNQNEGSVMIGLLNSKIFKSLEGPVKKLLKVVRILMKTRARKTSGMPVTKFSPLIQAIVNDKKQNVSTAAEVLELVIQLSDDVFVAQQIARLYIHSKNWIEAIKYGEMITHSEQTNSFLWDTYAQIFKVQLIDKYHESLETKGTGVALTPEGSTCDSLKIGFKAIETFRRAQEISVKEVRAWNNAGFYGEIETTARMMDFLNSVSGLEDTSTLRQFLIDKDFVPPCLEGWDKELVRMVKDLPRSTERIFAKLDDENLQLKADYIDESEKKVSCFQEDMLIKHRECINTYLCEDSTEVPSGFTQDQTCRFWRRRITRLRGNTLRQLFDIRKAEGAVDILKEIRTSAKRIIDSMLYEPRDLQVYIGVSIVLTTLGVTDDVNETELIECSVELYNACNHKSMQELEPYMYAFMLNWPGGSTTSKESQFPAHLLDDVMVKWKETFSRKYPRASEEKRRETTFFFLSKGTGILRYIYEGQLQGGFNRVRNAHFWNSDNVSSQLETLKGVLEHNGCTICVPLSSKGNKSYIYIPTSLPLRNSDLLHKEVHFYLGFTWSGPKAYNIRASCVPIASVSARSAKHSKINADQQKSEENRNLTFHRSTSRGWRGGSSAPGPSTVPRKSNTEQLQNFSSDNLQFNEKMQQLVERENEIREKISQENPKCGNYSPSHSANLAKIHREKNKLIEQQRRNTKGVEFN